MTTNGKRNRAVGHNYERVVAESFRKLGFRHVITSRNGNRDRDGQKVDLVNRDELVNGRFPYNVQCKCTTKALAYPKLLKQLPRVDGVMNVIFHKQTKKCKSKFMPSDRFVILYEKDFLEIVSRLDKPPLTAKLFVQSSNSKS